MAKWKLSKKYYPFLTEYIISLSKSDRDRSLQYAIDGIINMVEGITIRSKKQTSILIFYHEVFFIRYLCCTGVQELKVFLF